MMHSDRRWLTSALLVGVWTTGRAAATLPGIARLLAYGHHRRRSLPR